MVFRAAASHAAVHCAVCQVYVIAFTFAARGRDFCQTVIRKVRFHKALGNLSITNMEKDVFLRWSLRAYILSRTEQHAHFSCENLRRGRWRRRGKRKERGGGGGGGSR